MSGIPDDKLPLRQRSAGWLAARSLWVGGAAVVLAPLGNAVLPSTTGGWRWGLAAGLALVALLGFGVPAAKAGQAEERARNAEEAAVAEAADNRVALSDGLLPVLSWVVEGCSLPDRTERKARMASAVSLVVASAAKLCEPGSRARACWYELEKAEGPESVCKLLPRGHFGRASKPTTTFDTTSRRGQDLVRHIDEETTELWPDLSKQKPENWQPSSSKLTYKTFMVVPVRTATRPMGILTVDAEKADSLTEADVAVVRILGWILALVLMHTPRHTP